MASDFISTWASAIAQFEGYFTSGSVAARNNNPGNLKYAGQPGATGADPNGFAIFPTAEAGYDALDAQLSKYATQYPDDSLQDIMAHYLGQPAPTIDSQGNSLSYASFVAGQLGVDPTTTLAELSGTPSPSPSSLALATVSSTTDVSDVSDSLAPVTGSFSALVSGDVTDVR